MHDPDEAEKHCAACAQDLREFGEETSERYEYIPAQLIVIEDVCKKYACACTVKTAGKPSPPIEKSIAGAGLLSQVIVSKYTDHLPLNRQAKIFPRFGVELSVQTMCGWMGQCADLLDPLYLRRPTPMLCTTAFSSTPNGAWWKLAVGPAEMVEGRSAAKGNAEQVPAPRTQSRISCASMDLGSVRKAARRNRRLRFTALLHHITPQVLVDGFYSLQRNAAAGGGWSDVAGVREDSSSAGDRVAPDDLCRSISSDALAAGIHTQGRWPSASVGDCLD